MNTSQPRISLKEHYNHAKAKVTYTAHVSKQLVHVNTDTTATWEWGWEGSVWNWHNYVKQRREAAN